MQRCQLKKWASAGICACLLLASLTACGEQPAEAEASSTPTSSTMSETSSSPSSEPSPESSSQPESSSAPSESKISSASEAEPAVSSSSPASEAASSEPQSSAPPAPASSETPVSSEASASSGELMNKITVQFQDGNGNPLEVEIYPAMLEAPNVGIGLEGSSLDDLGVAETYINNRSFNGTTLSFSLAKGCNFMFYYRPADYTAFGLNENDMGVYNFTTDNGKATDVTFSLKLDGSGTGIYAAPTLTVTNKVYLE